MKKIEASIILVILAISAFAAVSTPHVKAQTTEATILSYTWYTAPADTYMALLEGGYAGDLVAVGEVQNTGTTTLGQIDISGLAYNSTQAVCSAETPVLAVPLLPGQKAPFYMDFNPYYSVTRDESWIPSVIAGGNVTLKAAIAQATNQTAYPNLNPTSLSGFDNSGVYTVTGNVENNGSQTASKVLVWTTFYDATGKVIGLNFTNYIAQSLAPNNSAPFVATPTDNSASLSNSVKSFAVLVESSTSTQTSTNPTPTPTQGSTTPTPTPTSSSTSPTKTKAPLNPLVTYGAISAVVIVAAVLAVLVLFRMRRRKGKFETLPPPPPPPPPPT